MWKGKKVSVVFSTYNEKGSIRGAIEDFFSTGYVDEIIVVNNNAVSGTDEEVKKTKAKLVYEKRQGYGYGYRRGLEEATGHHIIMSEPDGSFLGGDVIKLLAYSDEFDVVFGTRTTDVLIWQDANMGLFLKWGNVFVAKLVEFLYNTTLLTDVGCTMRFIKRGALENIQPYFTVGSSHFGLEMMLLIIKKKIKFIEIPINYKERVGESSVTGSKWKAFILGLVMICLVLEYRLKKIGGKRYK